MANQFDIVLKADDQVSEALKEIDEQVRKMHPELDALKDDLKLGGQDTKDGLNDVNRAFEALGKFAKGNVQFIGDMVPPLRNVVEFGGKFGGIVGKLGMVGGAAWLGGKAVAGMASSLADASDNAYGLLVGAENSGMTVQEFSRLSGAMRLLGSDSESAKGSVQGLFKVFNDALQGRNNSALAAMNQIHAGIVRNIDGTANVMATMQQLANVFPQLAPEKQKTVADTIGLDDNDLQLLREGVRLKELLAKSDAVGLTIDPKVNGELVALNRSITDVSASWDGLKNRLSQKLAGGLLSDGSISDMLKGVAGAMAHPTDSIALGQMAGVVHGSEADWLKQAQHDKAFINSLPVAEKVDIITGMVQTSDEHNRLEKRYGHPTPAQPKPVVPVSGSGPTPPAPDIPGSATVNPRAYSVMNNNPWDIKFVGQQGAGLGIGNFARFSDPAAGITEADRQLQLYYSGESKAAGHRPLRTLGDIIRVASPQSDGNRTESMIAGASRQLNIAPDAQLDLSSVQSRSRVLAALFNQEGNNPYSAMQIESVLTRQQAGETRPPLLPSYNQPIEQSTPQAMTTALTTALKENGMKIELTLVNGQTGQRQTMTGTGSKVAMSMQFP